MRRCVRSGRTVESGSRRGGSVGFAAGRVFWRGDPLEVLICKAIPEAVSRRAEWEVNTLVGSLLLTLLPLLSGTAQPSPPPVLIDEPTPEWPWSPIRYILKIREQEQYKALKSLPERRAFIAKFWKALDPTPDTPLNELRAEFWRRVNLANALFHDSLSPGWKTDRGKIYILLGPPHERDFGQVEIWTYRALPLVGALPETRLAFFRNRSGEYKLSRTPPRYTPLVRTRGGSYLGDSPISVQFDVAAVQIIPGRILLPKANVSTEYFFTGLRPLDDYRTFRAADGSTFLVLDFFLDADQLPPRADGQAPPDLSLSGDLFRVGETEPAVRFSRVLTPEPESGTAAGEPLPFRIRFDLPPGSYRGEFTLLEPVSRRGAIINRILAVPDYRQALSLSSVTLTRPPKGRGEADSPPTAPIPWLSPVSTTFSPGETLYLSYQVYNVPHREDSNGLDVEYRFYLEKGERLEMVGQPVQLHAVQEGTLSYAVRLLSWPAAAYRVQVTVTDAMSGVSAFRETGFRIVEAPASDGASTQPSANSH